MSTDATPDHEKNLANIFDLDRTGLTKRLVDNIEQCYAQIDSAREDLKQVVAGAKEAQFTRRDVTAMKKIAKLRHDDKRLQAQEELEALQRIGHAVGFDLFAWADAKHE